MPKVVIESILSGQKKIEVRFSKNKIIPFSEISTGDIVYMKASGSDILGQFKVKKVIFFQDLDREDLELIFQTWGPKIKSQDETFDSKFQDNKKNANYGTLIFIGATERLITAPFKFRKRDQRGWIVLD